MELSYQSTRGGEAGATASQAILKGLANDGGLFMPTFIPKLDKTMEEMSKMDYQEAAYHVMKLFLTDYTEEELRECIRKAYASKFDTEEIAPLAKASGAYFLELFHGSTIAFKDMALSILPYLMTMAAKKNQVVHKMVILAATSGDTGKAAMAGFADVEGTAIIVFYPKDGVSPIQKLQMVTQKGANTHVVAIRGNFDDTQTGVKKIFRDSAFAGRLAEKGFQLSSANSINIGRLVPQVAYYAYAYAKLLAGGEIQPGEQVNVAVPTGNFGNILAAFLAKEMGVPIKTLICASNDNKVLYDFFTTGIYDKRREFILTNSPSMDILISSNLERLIYWSTGADPQANQRLMEELEAKGSYQVTPQMRSRMKDFWGGFATQEEVGFTIRRVFEDAGYLLDTHTGVACAVYEKYKKETQDHGKTVIVGAASPYKFSRSVMEAIGEASGKPGEMDAMEGEFALIERMSQVSGLPIPQAIQEIRTAPILHHGEWDVGQMKDGVAGILGV